MIDLTSLIFILDDDINLCENLYRFVSSLRTTLICMRKSLKNGCLYIENIPPTFRFFPLVGFILELARNSFKVLAKLRQHQASYIEKDRNHRFSSFYNNRQELLQNLWLSICEKTLLDLFRAKVWLVDQYVFKRIHELASRVYTTFIESSDLWNVIFCCTYTFYKP